MGEGTAGEQGLTITRSFDAPRELVFRALTEARHLRHWWGPAGFSWVDGSLDLRPGGMFHYCLRSPDGRLGWGKWVFREIVPPERLVFVSSFADERGNTVRSPFSPSWPLQILTTLTLTEQEGKTTVIMHGGPVNATDDERRAFDEGRASTRQGFAGTWERLDAYLHLHAGAELEEEHDG